VTSELSSNLLRPANFTLYSGLRHFCVNLLNLSKFRCRVKPRFGGNQDRNSSSTAGRFSCLFYRHSGENFLSRRRSHCAKFQTTTSDESLRAFRAHKRLASWVMQWGLFSVGLPTGVGGAAIASSSNPTNRLPTSHLGQATSATGGSTAHLQLFKNSTGYSLMQIAKPADFTRRLRDFSRITTVQGSRNLRWLWKEPYFCGKRSETRTD